MLPLTAHYESGKFVVSYDFNEDIGIQLETYDRIEIKELLASPSSWVRGSTTQYDHNDHDDDRDQNNDLQDDTTNTMLIAVQITNSSLPKDVVEINFKGKTTLHESRKKTGSYYFASFVNATEEKEIARSEVFFVNYEDSHYDTTNVEESSIIHQDKDVFELQLVSLDSVQVEMGSNDINNDDDDDAILASPQRNCELTVHWQYSSVDKEDEMCNALKNHVSVSDWIVVLPSNHNGTENGSRQDYLKNCYYQGAYVMASGEMSGTVVLRLAGYCKPDVDYQVFYYDTTISVCRGASEPFTVNSSLLPAVDLHNENDVTIHEGIKQQSLLFNSMAMMRYEVQKQMDAIQQDHLSCNPLLTIVPKPGKWEIMMEQENRKEHEFQMIMEEENASNDKYKKNQIVKDSHVGETDRADFNMDTTALDTETMEKITHELREKKKIFLFLGAGISVAAPASAPSWWTLMSTVLEQTFKAVPSEYQKIARTLATSDATRSPEEVMETYYFVLQDKLFSLFRLLEEGEPNANHRIIAKMAKADMLQSVLTTNFDEFIERALDEEGVTYQVICTTDEFKTFLDNGCKGFAVIKIHGTVSRPDTIVAVANHYKGGKGFGGVKAIVTHHFMKHHPTVFLGYSGWDFLHTNYQEFWKNIGEGEGETIYFVKYKGDHGGPNISKLVGRHIGQRLVLGEGIMPEYLCSIMSVFHPNDASEILNHHGNIGLTVGEFIVLKQKDYITRWVRSCSKVAILAILWNESSNLNEVTKSRIEKAKNMRGDSDPEAVNTDGLSAYFMQLAAQYNQGTICEDEYNRKQRRATMEISFSNLSIEKKKKEELVDLLLHEIDANPIFHGPNAQELIPMFPSYVMMSADAMSSSASARDIYDKSLKYVVNILTPLFERKDEERIAEVLYNMRYVHSIFLRIESEESKEEAESLIMSYARDAVDNKWSNDMVSEKNAQEVIPALTKIAFQQIDTTDLMSSLVKYVVDLVPQESSVDEIFESAFIIAISMERQAHYLSSALYSNPTMTQIIQMLSLNEDKGIPEELYERMLNDISRGVEPVLKVLRDFDNKGVCGQKLHPREIIATFDLAFVKAIQLCLKHIGDSAQIQTKRERNGFYPFDHLPSSASIYLSKRMQEAVRHINDDRAEQSALAMLVSLGEVTRNIAQMEIAVETSLMITEGKVTELTPPPIPEALAAAHQEDGNMEKALHYYKLALEGVQTFVTREKTDAIVLNACLILAITDKRAALRTAFDFSPYFSETQLNIIPKPGRSLLVQQCEAWAEEIGMTLPEARRMLIESPKDLSSNEDKTDADKNCTNFIEASTDMRSDNNDESASVFNNYGCVRNPISEEQELPCEASTLDEKKPSYKPAIVGGRNCGICSIM